MKEMRSYRLDTKILRKLKFLSDRLGVSQTLVLERGVNTYFALVEGADFDSVSQQDTKKSDIKTMKEVL